MANPPVKDGAPKTKGTAVKDFDHYLVTVKGLYTVAMPDDRDRLTAKPYEESFVATPMILSAGPLWVWKRKLADRMLRETDPMYSALHTFEIVSIVPIDPASGVPLEDQGAIDAALFKIGDPMLMNEDQMRRYVEDADFDMNHEIHQGPEALAEAIKLYKRDHTGYKVDESFKLHKASKLADLDSELRDIKGKFGAKPDFSKPGGKGKKAGADKESVI